MLVSALVSVVPQYSTLETICIANTIAAEQYIIPLRVSKYMGGRKTMAPLQTYLFLSGEWEFKVLTCCDNVECFRTNKCKLPSWSFSYVGNDNHSEPKDF